MRELSTHEKRCILAGGNAPPLDPDEKPGNPPPTINGGDAPPINPDAKPGNPPPT